MRISDWSSDVCSSDLAAPAFAGLVLPIAVVILVFLFAIQRSGTARVGAFFGPVMLCYFAVIAVLGIISIVQDRKSVVQGKSVSVRVDLGGRRIIKKKNNTT